MISPNNFDLGNITEAYRLGGKNVHWSDYVYDWYRNLSEEEQMDEKNLDICWDEDLFYADFDRWWNSLSENKQNEIYKIMFQ